MNTPVPGRRACELCGCSVIDRAATVGLENFTNRSARILPVG
jgi:hypothetical protein